jgi:flavin reductase (DIM6/NTAB) family NADH-FMN oxidoreductase RutF
MSEEGIPVLTGCVGALSCSLVARVPLDADALKIYGVKGAELDSSAPEQESELYLARVLRVESGGVEVQGGAVKDEKSTDTLPLVYYERGYRTISNLP